MIIAVAHPTMTTSHDLEASLERIRALRDEARSQRSADSFTRLQAKLDSARAKRAAQNSEPHPRAFTRLHAVGVGAGLLLGGLAFLYGAQTPSNTLPATPVVTADWRDKVSQADASQLVQPAPVAAPEPEPAPAPQPQMKYTEAGALAEMCAAGRQYREDVLTGFARHSQATVEVQLYAKYLSEQSPASVGQLVKAGNDGLWLDRC